MGLKKKKKKVIPSNLLTFVRVPVITRPSAAVLGAMETGIAANSGGCFQLIPISEKKRKRKENRLFRDELFKGLCPC